LLGISGAVLVPEVSVLADSVVVRTLRAWGLPYGPYGYCGRQVGWFGDASLAIEKSKALALEGEVSNVFSRQGVKAIIGPQP
jgi:hypothetical protein